MNWADCFHADSDEIIFSSKTGNPTLHVWLLNAGVDCSCTFFGRSQDAPVSDNRFTKFKFNVTYCLSWINFFCDAIYDLVPFLQFKKREEGHGGVFSIDIRLVCHFVDFRSFFLFRIFRKLVFAMMPKMLFKIGWEGGRGRGWKKMTVIIKRKCLLLLSRHTVKLLENSLKIKPQPTALDFENFS